MLATIYAGGIAVLGLWWKDTIAVHNFGDILTNVGRISGLLAAYGFVVLVGLMARLPPLERGAAPTGWLAGTPWAAGNVITLVTVHVLFITWGYAVTAHQSVTKQAVTFLTSYPDMLSAAIAYFFLLLVAAISARAARRKVSYEAWYYVHLSRTRPSRWRSATSSRTARHSSTTSPPGSSGRSCTPQSPGSSCGTGS